jgi:CO/xanthine dehydrogenase Mo-binding subunit
METDGAFTVVVGSIDLSGSDTSLALIAAQELGMAADAVIVRHDNSDTMPYSGITAASKTIYTVGAAVQAAARDARAQILNTAADMLEASANDLELKEGRVIVRGVPEKYVTLQQIAASSMQFGAPYEPIFGRGRSANRVASPMFAAHVAILRLVRCACSTMWRPRMLALLSTRLRWRDRFTAAWSRALAGRCVRACSTMRMGSCSILR